MGRPINGRFKKGKNQFCYKMKWNMHLKRLLGKGMAPTVQMKSAGGLISARTAGCGKHRIGSRATVMVQSIAPGARNTFSLSADTNEQTGRAV